MRLRQVATAYIAASTGAVATGLIGSDLLSRLGSDIPTVVAVEVTWFATVGAPSTYIGAKAVLRALGWREKQPWQRRGLVASPPAWWEAFGQIVGLRPLATHGPATTSTERGVSSHVFQYSLGPSGLQVERLPDDSKMLHLDYLYQTRDNEGMQHSFIEDELHLILKIAWSYRHQSPWSRRRLKARLRLKRPAYDAMMNLFQSVPGVVVDRSPGRSGKIKYPPRTVLYLLRATRSQKIRY